jgi:hypothetical protein
MAAQKFESAGGLNCGWHGFDESVLLNRWAGHLISARFQN